MNTAQNTKDLVEKLTNPLLAKLARPENGNTYKSFRNFLNGNKNIFFDLDVFLPSANENLQRDFVWTLRQQKDFIKKILLQEALGTVVLNLTTNKEATLDYYKVIDGKQRLTTIKRFLQGEFDVEGYFYKDIDWGFDSLALRLKFEIYFGNLPDNILVALFRTLNFFGTAQDYERFERIENKVK